MPDFLTPAWFTWINGRLATTTIDADIFINGNAVRVVFALAGAPSSLPHAVTFSLTPVGVSVASGDHFLADLLVTISFEDARHIAEGTLEGAQALREGRLKVRGDVNALVPFGSWMVSAQNSLLT